VAEFAARWREEVLAKRKPSTVRSANSHLDSHILPQLGKLRLDQVGPENQQVFVNQLAGASRKTVLNIVSTLSSMLATAKNWGYSSGEIAIRKLVLPKEVSTSPHISPVPKSNRFSRSQTHRGARSLSSWRLRDCVRAKRSACNGRISTFITNAFTSAALGFRRAGRRVEMKHSLD
jgi:hypothetical protein